MEVSYGTATGRGASAEAQAGAVADGQGMERPCPDDCESVSLRFLASHPAYVEGSPVLGPPVLATASRSLLVVETELTARCQ